jgi:uncharacterized integral membrane protein
MARDPETPTSPADETEAPVPETDDAPSGQREPVKDPLRRSRVSGTWLAVVALLVVIVLLAVFVLQNTQKVTIAFLWWDGRAPLAAALLIATAGGLLLAVAAGSLRILQLRRRVKRTKRDPRKD